MGSVSQLPRSFIVWMLFLALSLVVMFIGIDVTGGPRTLFIIVATLGFVLRYTQFSFYVGIALVPFLGILFSLPTGRWVFGLRAFGGSVDISLGELILFFVLAAWSIKLIARWRVRREEQRLPLFPLWKSYLFLFLAHLVSAFSPLQPNALLVTKFAFRPVLFSYLAFILLPVNFITSRRRLMATLAILAVVGTAAAVNGFVSLFFPTTPSHIIARAHPLPIFGVHALGENYNELADLLIWTAPATFALLYLVTRDPQRRLLGAAAGFQAIIALLTFTRTAWIALALQGVFLLATELRENVKRFTREIVLACLVLLPLTAILLTVSVSTIGLSSLSTRVMLTQIALQTFAASPWLGGGAGTFLDRVGSTRVFVLEYGDPLDSHGFIQKLAAETGLLGIGAMGIIFAHVVLVCRNGLCKIVARAERAAAIFLFAGAGGAFVYQLFNTDYWTSKLWLPIGLAFAGLAVFARPQDPYTG